MLFPIAFISRSSLTYSSGGRGRIILPIISLRIYGSIFKAQAAAFVFSLLCSCSVSRTDILILSIVKITSFLLAVRRGIRGIATNKRAFCRQNAVLANTNAHAFAPVALHIIVLYLLSHQSVDFSILWSKNRYKF